MWQLLTGIDDSLKYSWTFLGGKKYYRTLDGEEPPIWKPEGFVLPEAIKQIADSPVHHHKI